MRIIEWIVISMLVVVTLLVGYIVYDAVTATTISIRKDEWKCTDSHKTHSFIMAGKVLVPQTHTICDVYSRGNV